MSKAKGSETFVWSLENANCIDKLSSEKFGIPAIDLMKRAGKCIADAAASYLESNNRPDHTKNKTALVLAGPGNNGGDAYVAARMLVKRGVDCIVISVKEAGQSLSDLNRQQIDKLNLESIPIREFKDSLNSLLSSKPDLIIDGLLGSGFRGKLRPLYRSCLEEARKLDVYTIAIDVPSGLNGNLADQTTAPFPAHQTITFGAYKAAHVLAPAFEHCGTVTVYDIGFSNQAIEECLSTNKISLRVAPDTELLKDNKWKPLSKNIHKFDRGHILVIGGSKGKLGAPILSGLAALRCGAGWVSLALPISNPKELPRDWPLEFTFEDFFEGGVLNVEAALEFIKNRKVKAVAFGPGVTDFRWSEDVFNFIKSAASQGCFFVIDAGTLKDIGNCGNFENPQNIVLTPHPGEWIKLSTPPPARPEDFETIHLANQWCQTLGVSAIYKNARPLVFSGLTHNQNVHVLTCGSNILAKAGSGDILAGLIAAHAAIGYNAELAMMRAYTLLSEASLLAANKIGADAVIARDFIDAIGNSN